MSPLRSLVHRAGRAYIRHVCSSETDAQAFKNYNERSIEYGFALQAIATNHPKTVLDVGTGTTAWPHLLRNCGAIVTAIDNVTDYWPEGMVNRHWTVLDVDITKPGLFSSQRFEAVMCISVLEHIADHEAAMRNMLGMINKGGSGAHLPLQPLGIQRERLRAVGCPLW